MHHLTRVQRAALWVVDRLPQSVVSDTERVGLSLGFIGTGILSLMTLSDENSVFTKTYPDLSIIGWSIMLLMGGILTIWGMEKSHRAMEMMGVGMAGLGCLIYSVTLLWLGDGRSKVVGILFLALAAIKGLRILIAFAATAYRTTLYKGSKGH